MVERRGAAAMDGDMDLISFKAGRVVATAKGNRKWQCEADPRKGTITLTQVRAGEEAGWAAAGPAGRGGGKGVGMF